MVTKENAGVEMLKHRNDKKLTQIDVSKKSGISVQTICAIEGGNIKPQSMTLWKINQYLDTFKTVNNG